MTETDLTGVNPVVFPELATWEWPVAAYLFLGGLVGGLMIFVSVFRLRRDRTFDRAVRIADMWALPLLAAGLLMLFVDLSYKIHSWRFFTSLQITSPMSWGSWILLLAGVILALRLSIHLPTMGWFVAERGPRLVRRGITALNARVSTRTRPLDVASIVVGAALAFYTGILLSTIPARPLWDSVVLAPLFLVSGVAAAGAFVCLFLPPRAHRRLTPTAMALCGGEILLIGGFFLSLGLGSDATSRAAGILTEWPYGLLFWGLVVAVGLLIPLAIETAEVRDYPVPARVSRSAPILKLLGSAGLRYVIVLAGLQTVM
jgi:formate-dependent nitrite reductase membrane component NrfD